MNKEAFKSGNFVRESRTCQIHSALTLPAPPTRTQSAQPSIINSLSMVSRSNLPTGRQVNPTEEAECVLEKIRHSLRE
jgi:hypothetical protein